MGVYIPYTEEQKTLAASVNLERFLDQRNETLERSGREKRLESDHSITINGSEWYDHSAEIGGNAISFVQNYYGVDFQEAMNILLNSQNVTIPDPVQDPKPPKPRKPFGLPGRNSSMHRVYKYLQARFIPVEILDYFVRTEKLYESREQPENTSYIFHNAIFVGYDIDGKPRHAHKHGVSLHRKNFKGNIESADPCYGFSHIGHSDRLYVFESPIDMLSFIALYPQNWQEHSYICLSGLSKHALLKTLEEYSHLQKVILCLDHDEAGIEAAGKLTDELQGHGYTECATLLPRYKDWNEDVRAQHGVSPLPAEEHPQILMFEDNLSVLGQLLAAAPLGREPQPQRQTDMRKALSLLQAGQYEAAFSQAWDNSLAWANEYVWQQRQLGNRVTEKEICEQLRQSFAPHHNRRNAKGLAKDISLRAAEYAKSNSGAAFIPQREQLAEDCLHACLQCQMLVVRTVLDKQKLEQKLEKHKQLLMAEVQ